VLAQTHDDYEIVVVDDGSQDGTAALAERVLAGRGRVHSQANRGLPGARNAGIEQARGRWMAFVDADDLWMPTYLERMRPLLEAGAGIAYCDAWVYDDRRRRIARTTAFERYRPARPPTDSRTAYFELLRDNFLWVAACVPRDIIDAAGGFDERLRASEDWNMWLRLTAAGARVAGTTECLGLYRHSDGQMHSDPQRMFDGRRDAVRSVLERADLDPELRAATEAKAVELTAVAAAGSDEPRYLPLLRLLNTPVRGIRSFRRRPPAAVAAAFPELF
jgi:glycosyltransferase involved in cell wall biosynthesis